MTRLATPEAILVDYTVGVCATVASSSGRVALVKRINLSFNLQIFRLPNMSRLPIFYRPQPGVVAIQLMAPDSPGVKLVGRGSHRISDPAFFVSDPLSLITNHVPHN